MITTLSDNKTSNSFKISFLELKINKLSPKFILEKYGLNKRTSKKKTNITDEIDKIAYNL